MIFSVPSVVTRFDNSMNEGLRELCPAEDHWSAHLQRLEDIACAECAALSMTSVKFGRGNCEKKMLKKYVQSRYVYENKQISDKMPNKKSDIFV